MKKNILIAAMIALAFYSAVAFSQLPTIGNREGCYVSVEANADLRPTQMPYLAPESPNSQERFPELMITFNKDDPKFYYRASGATARYYFPTETLLQKLPSASVLEDYVIYYVGADGKLKSFKFQVSPTADCESAPEEEPSGGAGGGAGGGAAAPTSGGISQIVLTKVMRALLNIQTTTALHITISPAAAYVSSESPNNEAEYTLTFQNSNTLSRVTAFIDNVDEGGLVIKKDGADLTEGQLMQVAAGGTEQVKLKVSGTACTEGCTFSMRISSKLGEKLLGTTPVSATYTMTAAPPPGIRVIGDAEKEGAINAVTRSGSPMQFLLEMFHPEEANEGLLPYNVVLNGEPVSDEDRAWKNSVKFYAAADGKKSGSSSSIIQLTRETKVRQVIAEVTPPSGAQTGDSAEIRITAKRKDETLTNEVVIKYTISRHGDGVCDEDERGTSLPEEQRADCKPEPETGPRFICDGPGGVCSYHDEDGTGVGFTVRVENAGNIELYNFLVCRGDATTRDCVSAFNSNEENCKFTKRKDGQPWDAAQCIAADAYTTDVFDAFSRCIDSKTSYYFLVSRDDIDEPPARSANTYSLECPNIDLKAIAGKLSSLTAKENQWTGSRSSAETEKDSDDTPQEKIPQLTLCIDTVNSALIKIEDKKRILAGLMDDPSKKKADMIFTDNRGNRISVDRWYNDFVEPMNSRIRAVCLDKRGLEGGVLDIKDISISPPSVEKGQEASIRVNVERRGTTAQPYYGYVRCEITKPGSAKETIELTPSCSSIETYTPSRTPPILYEKTFGGRISSGNAAGELSAKCDVYGSLSQDCAGATLHDTTTTSGVVYSNDVSISGASSQEGTCRSPAGSGIVQCLVTLSGNDQAKTGFAGHPLYADRTKTCAACDIIANGARNKCAYAGRNEANLLVSIFNCSVPGPGTYQLKAYVSGEGCNPAEPKFSSEGTTFQANALCSGVGDGAINGGEQCDLSYTIQDLQTQCQPQPVIDPANRHKAGTKVATACDAGTCIYPDEAAYACSKSAAAECDSSSSAVAQAPITLADGSMCTPVKTCNLNTCEFEITSCVPTSIALSITPALPTRAHDVTITTSAAAGISNLALNVDRTLKALTPLSQYSHVYTIPKGTLSLGEHMAELTASDASGNTYKTAKTFRVENAKPVISGVSGRGECIAGRQISIECAASDPDGTRLSGTIAVNEGTAQPVTFSGGVASVTYSIPSDATGKKVTAVCNAKDNDNENADQVRNDVCSSVGICPTTPKIENIALNPAEPEKGKLLGVSFTSDGASHSVSLERPNGQLLATLIKDAASLSGSTYVYKQQLPPGYSGDAVLVITGTAGDCTAAASRDVFIKPGAAPLPSSIELKANPSEIKTTDGRSVITATLKDADGRLMPYEATIWFEKTKGTLSGASCTTKSDESSCSVHLTASNMVEQSVVTAKWNGKTAQTTVRFELSSADNPPGIFNPKPWGIIAPGRYTLSVVTDESAACKYSAADASFDSGSMTAMNQAGSGTVFVSSSPSQIDFAAGTYTYYFKCRDSDFGNEVSLAHSFNVEAVGGPPAGACTGGDAPVDGPGVVKTTASGTGTWSFRESGALGVCEWTCNAAEYVRSGSTCVSSSTAKVATPTITPNGGTFNAPVDVTLATATSGASIRYTLDGTEPSASSASYSTPIRLTETKTLKAKAFKSGMTDSDIAQATFTITLPPGESSCGAGTQPASPTGVERGATTYTGSALSWSYQQTGELTACKWRCGFGFAKPSGENACVPTFAVNLRTTPELPVVNQQFTMEIDFVNTNRLFVEGITSGTKICNASPCQLTDTKTTAGAHTYTFRNADLSQPITKTIEVRGSNAPVVVEPVLAEPSVCQTGGVIKLKCKVNDADPQDRENLDVSFFVGKCDPNTRADITKCFNTREWKDLSVAYQFAGTKETAGNYYVTYNIPAGSSGKGVAATCRATDKTNPDGGEWSNWGDAYPVCVIDVCDKAPRITELKTYRGTESTERLTFTKSETLTIKFKSDTAGIEPVVKVKSGTNEYAAARQTTGTNPYEFRLALMEVPAGTAQVIVAGVKDDSCIGSRLADIVVQDVAPQGTGCTGGEAPPADLTNVEKVEGTGTWDFREAAGSLTACQWRCASTHVKNGNTCVPKQTSTPACTDVDAQTMRVCTGDDVVSENTRRILVTTCGTAKCEYQCKAGYSIQNDACVATNPIVITPTSPSGTISLSTATLSWTTNRAVNCRYSETETESYSSMQTARTSTGTLHSWSLTGLTNGEKRYRIACTDGTIEESVTHVFSVSTGTGGPPAGTPAALRLIANPERIQTGGGSRQSQITATFLNNAGQPLVFSGTISFATTRGSLTQTSCPVQNGESSCGVILISSPEAGTAIVTATYAGAEPDLVQTASVEFSQDPVLDTTAPQILNARPTADTTITSLPFMLHVGTDEPARCRYATTPGNPYSSMGQTTTLQNSHDWQISEALNGVNRFYIKCADAAGNDNDQDFVHSVNVQVPTSLQAVALRLGASNPSIVPDGVSTSAITATLLNSAGNPVPATRTITFTTTLGSLLQSTCQTNGDSSCSVTLRSSTTPGIATIKGTSGSLANEYGVQFGTPQQFTCTGTQPANSELCPGDNIDLSQNTAITLAETCAAPKCEYRCVPGFVKSGTSCVPSAGTQTCGGTAPSGNGVEKGASSYSAGYTPTSWTPKETGTLNACEWRCSTEYMRSGSSCVSSGTAKVATPTITPNGGTFSAPVDVTLATATSGASIRYTLDGLEPSLSSNLYSTPIRLTETKTLKAKAFKSGMTDSDIAQATFTITTAGGALTCGGTQPENAAGVVKGPSTFASGYTPASWTFDASATTSTPCKWKCDTGYAQNGNMCTSTGTGPSNVCVGNFANAQLCSGDSGGLASDVTSTLVSECTSAKCEYTCNSGFTRQGSECLINQPQLNNTKITAIAVANETLLRTPILANVTLKNFRSEARSAFVTCRFNSTRATSSCISLAADAEATIQISSLAQSPGPVSIACSINSTADSSCQNSAFDNLSVSKGTFVTEPRMLYIASGIIPQSVFMNSPINAQISVKNPIDARYGVVSCAFTMPDASTLSNSSQCLHASSGMHTTFPVRVLAGSTGIWQVGQCNVTTSRSATCSSIDNASFFDFNQAINVLDRINLTINSILPVRASVPLGDRAEINVSVSNPLQVDKFARVSCRVTRPNGNQQDFLRSACTPMPFQSTDNFILNFTPSSAGNWTISSCSVEGSFNADCSSPSQEDNVATSQKIAVQSDTGTFVPISVLVSHSPSEPRLGETVAVTASSASSNLMEIRIQVDDQFRTCSTSPCSISDIYRAGTHTYFATAKNTFAQTARDPPGNGTKPFTVVPSAGNVSAGGCSIVISSPSCIFNKRTQRYDVSAVYSWRGGDHSRVIIDGIEKVQVPDTSNFTYAQPVATPGEKSITAKVEDASNRRLCDTSARIVCAPAEPVEELLVQREMPEVSKPGFVMVRLNVKPGRDIQNFTLKENIIQGLVPINIAVQSNTSYVNMTGPRNVPLDRDYSEYKFMTRLTEGRNMSISYRLNIEKEGEYSFLSISEYDGKRNEERATLLVTNCDRPVRTLAVSPDGQCSSFRTDCEVPIDWRRVDECPLGRQVTEQPPEKKGDATLAIIIVVVVLVAAIVLVWRYEDEIRERIRRLKERIEKWREGKEEKKPWEREDYGNSA